MTEIMDGVTEYEEGMDVELVYENNRLAIRASNEAGHCCTRVDLIQLLDWVKTNKPELINRPWVGLTDAEVQNIVYCRSPNIANLRKAEQLLKDKNT